MWGDICLLYCFMAPHQLLLSTCTMCVVGLSIYNFKGYGTDLCSLTTIHWLTPWAYHNISGLLLFKIKMFELASELSDKVVSQVPTVDAGLTIEWYGEAQGTAWKGVYLTVHSWVTQRNPLFQAPHMTPHWWQWLWNPKDRIQSRELSNKHPLVAVSNF